MNARHDVKLSTFDVLVIDDDTDTLDLIIAFLSRKGIHVAGLSRAGEHLEAIEGMRPRVLLLDVNRPGLNGYDSCSSIKADEVLKMIIVYFLTAMPPEDVKRHVKSFGTDGFLKKRFTFIDLGRWLENRAWYLLNTLKLNIRH
ncbi:MAG: response regulator [Candidatus Lokiarchaeota archaeon]|nr:response regulator [Candidatus Lokiarchaeota archaeon]